MTAARPPRLWPYLLANAVAAGWIDFGRIHRLHSADSIIFTLSSLYEWRPFFWEQDRVGMLWPLLFSWCHHPLANLLLLTGTTVYLGLCLPVLMARAITPHPAAPAIATGITAAVLWLAPKVMLETLLVVCNFPGALVLGLSALLLLDRKGGGTVAQVGRVVVAWVLLLAGCWLYIGVVVFLVPFAVYRGWLTESAPTISWWRVVFRPVLTPSVVLFLVGCGLACGAVVGLMKYVDATDPFVSPTPNATLPPEEWPGVYACFATELYRDGGWWLTAVLTTAATFGLGWGLWRHRREVRVIAVQAIPAVLAAAGEFALLGSRQWVKEHYCHPRYLVAVLCAVVVSVLVVALAPVIGRWRWAGVAAFALLFAAATAQFGWPGRDAPRRGIEQMSGTQADALTECQVEAIAGGYWQVWPSVFEYNLARYERGEPPAVGISLRSRPWMHRWRSDVGRVLRVGLIDDGSAKNAADHLSDADIFGEVLRLERLSDAPLQRVGRVNVYEYRVKGQ